MKEIKLTQGKVAIVDDEDFEYLNQRKWYYLNGYAVREDSKDGFVYMHRTIINTPKGMETDHINHNGLDNRKSNLRICTTAENHGNLNKYKSNLSGFKGVSFQKDAKKWRAQIKVRGVRYHLGYYKTSEEAARAYDSAALILFGTYSKTNFMEAL